MILTSRALYQWFDDFTLPDWIAFSLAGNFAIFGASVALCA